MSPDHFAVMFADVSGSSRLYKAVGDVQARMLVSAAVDRMLAAVEAHGGTLVKTIGDEVMARFPTAEDAVNAAIRMQRDAMQPIKGEVLPLRIGLNAGQAILEGDDVFGEAVNDAAALVKIARARQIVSNADTLSQLSPGLQARCTVFDRVVLKGGRDEENISLVGWDDTVHASPASNATVVMGAVSLSKLLPAVASRLTLSYLGRNLEVDVAATPFHIGREAGKCQLVVDSHFASRSHCSIEYRRGKFVLVDHSTNGTYAQIEGNPPMLLRREELPLGGQGEISIGQPVGTAVALTIRFLL